VGALLPRGETVELVIAVGPAEPELVTVPDVTGLEVKRAFTVLKEAGLRAEPRIERVETATAKPGTVLGQRPQPGSRVRFNETVSLVYAVAPPH
jgi:beta-lactam-binding protein with PASTA domain